MNEIVLSPEALLWIERLLPIVVGAAIGFITNAIAIRMLFRPLKEYRFLGLRIPFTPGIIPKQRYALAESVGSMVSGDLLSREALIAHIRGEEFGNTLQAGISGLLSQDARQEHPKIVLQLTELMRRSLTNERIEAILVEFVAALGRLRLEQLIPSRLFRGRLTNFLNRQIDSVSGPALVEQLVHLVSRMLEEERTLDSVITEDLRAALFSVLAALYEPAVAFLFEWLRRPPNSKELTIRGKQVLKDIILQLTSIQRLLLSAGQYDRQLEDRMPAIVKDLLNTFEHSLLDPRNRVRVLDGFKEALGRLSAKKLSDIQTDLNADFPSLARKLGQGILETLKEERVALRFEIMLRRFMGRHSRLRLSSIVHFLTGRHGREIALQFSKSAGAWLHSPGDLEVFLTRLYAFLVQDSSGLEDSAGKMGLSIQNLMEKAIPEMVERFDVKTLVVNRINSLDVLAVENLLLSIMAKHFKWINIFGAILGALIGAIQLIKF